EVSAAAGASGRTDEPLPLQAALALLRPPGSHRARAESLGRLRPAHASHRLHLNSEHRPNLIPLSTCVSPPRTAARFPPLPLPSRTRAPSLTDPIPFPRSPPLLGANNTCPLLHTREVAQKIAPPSPPQLLREDLGLVEAENALAPVHALALLVAGIIMVVQCFKVRRILLDHLAPRQEG